MAEISKITILKEVDLDLLSIIKLNLSKSKLQSGKHMYIALFAWDSALTNRKNIYKAVFYLI